VERGAERRNRKRLPGTPEAAAKGTTMNEGDTIPRRADTLRQWDAERAIGDAMEAVETMGAHTLLTDAVVLLEEARRKVADYIDTVAIPTEQADTGFTILHYDCACSCLLINEPDAVKTAQLNVSEYYPDAVRVGSSVPYTWHIGMGNTVAELRETKEGRLALRVKRRELVLNL
jgi:hypothetical protein